MAEHKKSFILYCDQKGLWDKLSDEQAGKLIKHIISFVNDENPTAPDFITELAFEPIKQQLKRDLKNWEKQYDQRVEAGKRSAEIRKRNATSVNDRSISSTVNGNVNGNVNEYNKAHTKELSVFISVAYKKKYNRHEDGEIGQDIDYLSERLLQNMTKQQAMDQIRNHKLYTGLEKLTLPSKLETIQAALLETDWIQRMKEKQDSETTQSQITNEQARNKHRNGSGITETIAPAYNGRIDTE